MKLQNPFFFCLILAAMLFLYKTEEPVTPTAHTGAAPDLKLVVERGAFHYDRFEVKSDTVWYTPGEHAQHPLNKYNLPSQVSIQAGVTKQFLADIEQNGFWKLKTHYWSPSSCTSLLKVSVTQNGMTKTVFCKDFERDCPKVIQYIEKKVVEWEGNGLKRNHLPG